MAKPTPFSVLVATDGSAPARAAVAATVVFPWPEGSRASGVVARGVPTVVEWPDSVWEALALSQQREAQSAQRVLRRRWPEAEVAIVNQPPVDGILAQAQALGVRTIVLGSRGHGAWSRLVLGSVSLGVVRRASCAVLVVKRRLPEARRLVIGIDGSPHSRGAVDFVAGLATPRGDRVTLVAVVEPVRPPSMGLLPASVRAVIAGEATAVEGERRRAAQREIESAARRLSKAGWTVRTDVRAGVPLAELLAAVTAARADVLVVGARGVGGVERLLLGSVAEGGLNRSPASVLIVK